MTRTVRRRIPAFVCASALASTLAFSIAAPTAQAAPEVPAQTTASQAVPTNWCNWHPYECGWGPTAYPVYPVYPVYPYYPYYTY